MSTNQSSYAAHAAVLLVPGRLESRTGGYEYDRRIAAGLRERGWSVEVKGLDESFPTPTAAALDHATRALAAIPDGTIVVIDGLALGAMPVQVESEAARLRLVALVHLPLAAEVGIDRETAVRLEASERRALAAVALVIVTGTATVDALTTYGVPRDRMAVVEPGTGRAGLAHGSGGFPLHLLSVAALIPRKGHEILIQALAAVPDRNWHLTCAGSLERDPATVERVRATAARLGVADRVSLAGELGPEDLDACYDRADVFVLATLKETYGMAVAEALAHGLPVVSTRTGSIPELVAGSAAVNGLAGVAGVIVPPGDQQALADALSMVLGDARVREQLAEGARRVRERLPTWEEASSKISAALGRIAPATERPLRG